MLYLEVALINRDKNRTSDNFLNSSFSIRPPVSLLGAVRSERSIH